MTSPAKTSSSHHFHFELAIPGVTLFDMDVLDINPTEKSYSGIQTCARLWFENNATMMASTRIMENKFKQICFDRDDEISAPFDQKKTVILRMWGDERPNISYAISQFKEAGKSKAEEKKS